MKRKDCFFGLHFDFHANKEDKNIGKEFSQAVVERIMREVKPDFVQCDTKGHPGYSSYMTNVGSRADLAYDIVAGWRAATKKYGIPLYAHHSGVWDIKVANEHPDWVGQNEFMSNAADRTSGMNASDKVSPFSPYKDEILIPQLKELALEWGLDGAWVDGECWAMPFDLSSYALNAFKKETGKDFDFEKASEDEKKEYVAFLRRGFYDYIDYYIKEVKKVAPDFELTSNWLNTSHAPENVHITDYTSGDLYPIDAVDSARYDARIMQSFGTNWDIMAWGISWPVHHTKSAVQLQQEASAVIAHGGAFQIYNLQHPQKTIVEEWAIPIWADVAKFCRERQAYVHRGNILPDLGILFSNKAHRATDYTSPFSSTTPYNLDLKGIIPMFADTGRAVSVINAERMAEGLDISGYRTIVLSNIIELEDGIKEKLLAYVKCGGELVLTGVDTTKLFAEELGLTVEGYLGKQPLAYFEGDDYMFEFRAPYAQISGVEKLASVRPAEVCGGDLDCPNPPPAIARLETTVPSLGQVKYGEGKVLVVPATFGDHYKHSKTYCARRFVREILKNLKPGAVWINRPASVDVVLSEKNGKEYIHLVNLLGEHRSKDISTFDEIPPVCDLEVRYQLKKTPAAVTLRPGGEKLPVTVEDGELIVKLDRVAIYDIIEICYE